MKLLWVAEYTSLCGLRPGQIVNPMTGQPEESKYPVMYDMTVSQDHSPLNERCVGGVNNNVFCFSDSWRMFISAQYVRQRRLCQYSYVFSVRL